MLLCLQVATAAAAGVATTVAAGVATTAAAAALQLPAALLPLVCLMCSLLQPAFCPNSLKCELLDPSPIPICIAMSALLKCC